MTSITIRPTEAAIAGAPGDLARYYVPAPENALRADPSRREPVSYASDGLKIAAHLYRPANGGARTPGIVMCGPFSSVKEQTLPHYAERFADAGYTVLTFDPRSFGESEGEPRAHYDPSAIVSDYVNGVGYLLTRDDIDVEAVVVVGVCMGGGFAISAAARDRRIRACASIAGGFNIGGTFQRFMGTDGFSDYLRTINDLHQGQRETGEIAYVPTIAHALSDDIPVAAMPNEEAYSYYDRTHRTDAPNWSDKMTAAGLEAFYGYNGLSHARMLGMTPLLIVHGTTDFFLLPEYAQAAYDAATGPKELVWIETHNHIEFYDQDPYVPEAVAAVTRWLAAHVPSVGPEPSFRPTEERN